MRGKWNARKTTRDAAVDMARLYSDDLSVEDERRITRRQQENESYLRDFTDIAKMLSDMKELVGSESIQSILNDQPSDGNRQKAQTALRKGWGGLAVAAGVSVVIATGLIAYSYLFDNSASSDHDVDRYVTRVGEQKQIVLEDGSLINLNTSSEVLVCYTDHERKVTLTRGEAFFDVVKKQARPFSVDLGNRAVTVLGTEFNIEKGLDTFSLAVIEGVVVLHNTSEQVDVSANLLGASESLALPRASQQYRVEAGWVVEFDGERGQLVGYESDNIESLQEWRTGLISFEGVPLYKVVQELNRYSPKKILIEDKSIMDLEVYATVRIDRIHTAVSGLERSHEIKVRRYYDRIVIVRETN